MKLYYSFLASLFALCIACSSEDPSLHQEIKKEDKLIAELPPQVNRSKTLTGDFSNTFKGHIGDKKTEMMLAKVGNAITGKYCYTEQKEFFDIEGTIEDNGDFVLYQLDTNGNKIVMLSGNYSEDAAQGFFSETGHDLQVPFVVSATEDSTEAAD